MVSLDYSACLFGAMLLFLVPLNWLSAAFFAAVFHELCHIAAVFLCGGSVYGLRIGIRGAELDVGQLSPPQEVLCAAAGPLGSFLLLMMAGRFPRLAICGFFQGCFNCLPVLPMDGGRLLQGILGMIAPRKGNTIFKMIQAPVMLCLIFLLFWAALRISFGLFLCLGLYLGIRWGLLRKRPCKEQRIGVQ